MQEAAAAATTPLGLWQTEDNKGNNKGNVRVEQCGANLCGYGETNNRKSKELVLIKMKPSSDNSKWTGRIHDPSSGKDYNSTIAMAGPKSAQGTGLRPRRNVLRRHELEAYQLIPLLVFAGPDLRPHHLIRVQRR